jgi:3-hydroxyisobutyrate dehydrogenase-like beta-hydroxyacid dehydrogenase
MQVAWIGLGLMGQPMARNLLRAGHSLTVWNRTAARTQALVAEGARAAATPAAAAAEAEVVFTCVSDPPALQEVLWGPQGVLNGLRAGAVLVDCSTVSPDLARRVAEACAARGAEFLEAPVTGGTWGAERGELTFLLAGSEQTIARVQPLLDALGRQFFHCGPHGAAQTIKLALNLLYALQVEGLAEALALVRAAGLPDERLLAPLAVSMGRSPLLEVKAPLMASDHYPPSFPLRLMHKDLGLALDLANRLGVALPATAVARELYSAVRASLAEDADYAAIARFWPRRPTPDTAD